jgi:hypothetical protein
MDLVVNTLDAGVAGSDLFMPVVSPLYVKKQYTVFELDGFVKARAPAMKMLPAATSFWC